MPTQNPRLTITLNPTLAAQLRRLSELTGNSQASLISELLEGSEQVFARMIRVLEAANEARHELRGSIGADLQDAQQRLEKQLGLALDTMDEGFAPLLEEAEAIKRRARKRAARTEGPRSAGSPPAAAAVVPTGDGRTPMSNRGVRSEPTRTKGSRKRGK